MSAMRFTYVGLGIAAVAGWAAVACGSDSGASAPPGGGGGALVGTGGGTPGGNGGFPVVGGGGTPPGGGGSPANGGAPPGGGGTPQGNGGGVTVTPSDITITGSVTQCSGTTATPVPATLTATSCTLPQCNHATCVERSLIQQFAPDIDQAALALLGTCGSADVFCIPNDFIATTGKFQTKTCVSLENAEGRCISTCVPQVKTQITTLPQADCLPDEKCAPCWNPIDGVTTGACDQGCDTGPTQPKVVFTECGSGAGVCVPKTLVSDPVQLKALEGVDDPTGICADTTRVCAPKLKAADQSAPFATCTMTSAAALLATMRNAAGQLAACVPKYIVPVGQQPLLLQDGCQANELCAPCYNPLPDAAGLVNQPTGACAHP